MTIPELGTIRATHPPVIVLTSNRTRDLHDAVKRRCLYQWIDYPAPEREVEIVRRRVKGDVRVARRAGRRGRRRGCATSDVQKPPGIAEAIDWLAALELLGVDRARRGGDRPHARLGAQVRRGPGRRPRRRARAARRERRVSIEVETIALDLPASSPPSGAGCTTAGVPVTPERSARFAQALALTRPRLAAAPVLHRARRARRRPRAGRGVRRRRSPRCSARAPTSRPRRRPTPARVAGAARRPPARRPPPRRPPASTPPAAAAAAPGGARRRRAARRRRCRSRPATRSGCAASASTRSSRASSPQLYRLMTRLRIATPERRTRRAVRDRRGEQHRPAAHAARQPAHRRRPDPAGPPAPARRPPPARAAVRHLGLDGALRARLPAVPHLRRRQRARRGGVRVRHAPDARDARARHAQPGARDPARRRGRARLVERDADRRRAARVQRPPRPPRDGARRGGRDPLRRLGARRARPGRARDAAARARSPTGSCGSTRA